MSSPSPSLLPIAAPVSEPWLDRKSFTTWALGIIGTLLVALIIASIAFASDTKADIGALKTRAEIVSPQRERQIEGLTMKVEAQGKEIAEIHAVAARIEQQNTDQAQAIRDQRDDIKQLVVLLQTTPQKH